MGNSKTKCTLTDEELLEACDKWIDDLCKSGGREWCLSVPVNFNRDPDMLFVELMNRFKALKQPTASNGIPPLFEGIELGETTLEGSSTIG